MGAPPPPIDVDSLNKVLSDQACEARKGSWIYNDKGAIALAFHLSKAWISIWFASQVSQYGNQSLECAFQMGVLKKKAVKLTGLAPLFKVVRKEDFCLSASVYYILSLLYFQYVFLELAQIWQENILRGLF